MPVGPVRIVHIISSLTTGGAEMMLFKLLSSAPLSGFEQRVICLSGRAEIGAQIERLGIQVDYLNLGGNLALVSALPRFRKLLRSFRPNILVLRVHI